MKKFFLIFSIGLIILAVIMQCNNTNNQKLLVPLKEEFKNVKPLSIFDGNQDSLIYPAIVSKKWLDSIKTYFDSAKYDWYNTKVYQYQQEIFFGAVSQFDTTPHMKIWNDYTKQQKVFASFLMFEGQIRNGGINQLFYNAPDYTLCILESFKELGLNEFQTEYTALCRALFGPFQNLPNLKNILSSEDSYRTEKFSNFIDYGIKIESGIKIEEMLFDKKNDEIRGNIMCKYIDDNYSKFYKLQ